MMYFLIHLFINTFALWAAARAVSGINYAGPWYGLMMVALVFGVLNAFVRPVLKIFSIPLLILTLGLFIFVLNAFMLWLTSAVSRAFELGFTVAGFWPALWGALVISVINMVLSCLMSPE
jgi:putative membrane protein